MSWWHWRKSQGLTRGVPLLERFLRISENCNLVEGKKENQGKNSWIKEMGVGGGATNIFMVIQLLFAQIFQPGPKTAQTVSSVKPYFNVIHISFHPMFNIWAGTHTLTQKNKPTDQKHGNYITCRRTYFKFWKACCSAAPVHHLHGAFDHFWNPVGLKVIRQSHRQIAWCSSGIMVEAFIGLHSWFYLQLL